MRKIYVEFDSSYMLFTVIRSDTNLNKKGRTLLDHLRSSFPKEN